MLLLEVQLTAWAYFPQITGNHRLLMKKGFFLQDRRLGARGHALWGAGAGAVLGAVRFRRW